MSLQVELLEQSFQRIQPNADKFMNSFYENLFTANPEAKPLFATTDMKAQKKKLLGSLVLVINNLRNLEVLETALRGLGARHIKYGALPKHYPLVGNALLTTFEQYLGSQWTPQVKQAWIDAYAEISKMMLEGADYSEADLALSQSSAAKIKASSLPVELLERTFEAIKPNAQYFVNSFYKNLFAASPEVKPLFENTDLVAQQQQLINSWAMVVKNLRMPNILEKTLRNLGARYVKHGALPEHYPLFGNALLITLKQYLGASWTPEIRQAWIDAYSAISKIMLDGANYSQSDIPLKPSSNSSTDKSPTLI